MSKLRIFGRAGLLPTINVTNSWKRPLTFSYLTRERNCVSMHVRNISSSIFISDGNAKAAPNFMFVHDLKERLADVAKLKANLSLRGLDFDVDLMVKEYEEYHSLEEEKAKLEAKRSEISKIVTGLVKVEEEQIVSKESTQMIDELRAEGRQVRQDLKELNVRFWELEESLMLKALALPVDLLPDVTDKEHIIGEYCQEKQQTTPVSHQEVLKRYGTAVKFSNVGNKAYYLRGKLAQLELRLVEKFSGHLRSRDHIQMCAPEMFRTSILEARGLDVTRPDTTYRLQPSGKPDKMSVMSDWDQDLVFLQGASQSSFLAYLARMKIRKDSLPLKMFVVGRSYMPETEETKSLPGLLGVLQSIKIHACCVTESQAGVQEEATHLQSILTDLYTDLGLPFRLVSLPASSLTSPDQSTVELQMLVPSLQRYLKVASVSVCGDFSSRRLMITTGSKKSAPVYMTHCELADITRLIAVMMEYDVALT